MPHEDHILYAADRMAATFGAAGALDTPPPRDPGSWVSQAQLDEYIVYVNSLIRDMNAYLVNNEPLPPGAVNIWPRWVKFKIQWESESKAQRDDNWYVSRDDWDTVRSFHDRALEFKRQFESAGIVFSQVVATPQPVKDPQTGEPVIDKATGKPAVAATVANVPNAPIRGTLLPAAPTPDDGLSTLIPSKRTIILAAGAIGGFILLKTFLENR